MCGLMMKQVFPARAGMSSVLNEVGVYGVSVPRASGDELSWGGGSREKRAVRDTYNELVTWTK